MVRDISSYGVFVHSEYMPDPGDLVELSVALPRLTGHSVGATLRGTGTVIRVEPHGHQPAGFAAEVVFHSGWATPEPVTIQ